jgi:hypothetical protein
VAVLSNPTHPAVPRSLREAEVSAQALKMRLQTLEARTPTELAATSFRVRPSERALDSSWDVPARMAVQRQGVHVAAQASASPRSGAALPDRMALGTWLSTL